MTSFILKIIAIVTMFIDHLGDTIFKGFSWLNLIGRIAFPIFAFQISEGYLHTKNLKKYFLRLFLFAIISQIPFMLFLSTFSSPYYFNVFFTLLFGLFAIFIYDKILAFPSESLSSKKIIPSKSGRLLNPSINFCKLFKQFLGIFVIIFIGFLAELLNFDYGFFGVAIIFIFYVFKDNKIAMSISYVIACILKYIFPIINSNFNYNYVLICLFTILPLIPILLYNKKQGKKVKYFLYFFYPVHLIILYFISYF